MAHLVAIPFDLGSEGDGEYSKVINVLTWSKGIPTIDQLKKYGDEDTIELLKDATPIEPPEEEENFYNIGFIFDGEKDWLITATEMPVIQIED